MNLDKYDVSEFTHRLLCRHAIGRNGTDYTMKCTLLKKTKAGFAKVIVFGDRYWKNRDHIKYIRYVLKLSLIKR